MQLSPRHPNSRANESQATHKLYDHLISRSCMAPASKWALVRRIERRPPSIFFDTVLILLLLGCSSFASSLSVLLHGLVVCCLQLSRFLIIGSFVFFGHGLPLRATEFGHQGNVVLADLLLQCSTVVVQP